MPFIKWMAFIAEVFLSKMKPNLVLFFLILLLFLYIFAQNVLYYQAYYQKTVSIYHFDSEIAYSSGYPFSISGDIRSLPS